MALLYRGARIGTWPCWILIIAQLSLRLWPPERSLGSKSVRVEDYLGIARCCASSQEVIRACHIHTISYELPALLKNVTQRLTREHT